MPKLPKFLEIKEDDTEEEKKKKKFLGILFIILFFLVFVGIVLGIVFGVRGCTHSRTGNTHKHIAGEPVKQNVVESTFDVDGSYDLITYCTECGEEISHEHKTEPKLTYLRFELNSDGLSYKVIDVVKPYPEDIKVPATYSGLPVTRLGSQSFDSKIEVKTVTLPDSVTFIEYHTFFNCKNLEYITFSNSLEEIEFSAFIYCSSLKTVTLPESVTKVGGSAFCMCKSLESVTLPNSITSIGNGCFEYCSSLTEITLPNNLTSYGGNAFRGCNLQHFNEYDNGLYLGSENNPYMLLVKAKDDSLTSVDINDNCLFVEDSAFESSYYLESITLPDSVTFIGDHSFQDCHDVTSITLSNNLTHIGDMAFHNCYEVTSIAIPHAVTYIGSSAFELCEKLSTITYDGTLEEWEEVEKKDGWAKECPAIEVVCSNGNAPIEELDS